MKIHYEHIVKCIQENPDETNLSNKLFQLGHEHEINEGIFDFEFTPNRGDCLSINGLLRDLNLFFDVKLNENKYDKNIDNFAFNFKNNLKNHCPKVSFLKIEIDELPNKYEGELNCYFNDLDLNKNNFFTDISNYISYETGQPTHCYDSLKLGEYLILDKLTDDHEFETLFGNTINLSKGDMVFLNKKNEVVNLAGIVGGKKTACDLDTRSVIVECANFDPELIVGRCIKYNINSEAAHKFERGTDINCHDFVLRRFIEVVEKHVNIKSIEIYTEPSEKFAMRDIKLDLKKINQILGVIISERDVTNFLKRLGFQVEKNMIIIPSYRNDINTINDISEEIARAVGYDNIPSKSFNLELHNKSNDKDFEYAVKNLLISHGFFEVINNPFISEGDNNSITVDNPLDINKSKIRTNLKNSLIENLLYNERRQQDTIKLFEISDVYNSVDTSYKKVLGIIATGRVGNNYQDFSKKIDKQYITNIFEKYVSNIDFNIEDIPRANLNTKHKSLINYLEIDLELLKNIKFKNKKKCIDIDGKQYKKISDFPKSKRDISFSIKDASKYKELEVLIDSIDFEPLKEVFVFDFFKNTKKNEIKIGYRFIFQMQDETITDKVVNDVINEIISRALSIKSVSVPGLV